MKVVPSKDDSNKKANDLPPLPLVPESEEVNLKDSTKYSSFKLKVDPTDKDSSTFSFGLARVDGTQTLRQHLKWCIDVKKIHKGLSIKGAPSIHRLNMELCQGSAKTAYENGVLSSQDVEHARLKKRDRDAEAPRDTAGGETQEEYDARLQRAEDATAKPNFRDEDVEHGYKALIRYVAPYKALERQKRFMRRKMRKPADMKTRTYVSHIEHLNEVEIPLLPPASKYQKLPPDEIKDIVCYGLPRSWTRKMDEFDFDPLAHSIGKLIEFCERIESSEEMDGTATQVTSKKSPKKQRTSPKNSSNGDKWCAYHESDTHNTEDCITLKNLKKKQSDGGQSKNKSWSRKSDDAKKFSKKEISAIAKKAGKKAIRDAKRQLYAMSKEDSDSDVDSQSSKSSNEDDNNSVHMMEASMAEIDRQLQDFDFTKMDEDNKSDGEVSC